MRAVHWLRVNQAGNVPAQKTANLRENEKACCAIDARPSNRAAQVLRGTDRKEP